MQKRIAVLGTTFALAFGLALSPVQISFDGVSVDTAAAAGKSGGRDCDVAGNPGNKKPVGQAGEEPPKGAGEGFFSPDEGGPGVRGRSDG